MSAIRGEATDEAIDGKDSDQYELLPLEENPNTLLAGLENTFESEGNSIRLRRRSANSYCLRGYS